MGRTAVTILLGATLVVAAAGYAGAVPSIPVSKFEPSTGCTCHSELKSQWQLSMHSKAIVDPIYQYKLKEAEKATDGALGEFCTQCHAPIAVMGGVLDGSAGIATLEGSSKEGVTCDFCHQVGGTEGQVGNASFTMVPEGTKRAQLKDSKSPGHNTAYSEIHETAEFCGNCHDVRHPQNGLGLESTYSEWKAGPYAAQGIVCQDCHMTPGPGVTKPNPGRAGAGCPDREHIYLMTFAGGNVGLGDSARAEERLKAAAELTIDAPEIAAAGVDVDLSTTITNVGAGHYLPTGLTDVRRMWLEVEGRTASGDIVLEGRHDFGTVFKGADGAFPVEVWDAVGVEKDDRIPPQESVTDSYTLAMADEPVTVTATLYYRSADEELAAAAGVDIPTTTMAKSTVTLYNDAGQRSAAVEDARAAARKTEGGGFPVLGGMLGVTAILAIAGGAWYVMRKRA